MIGGIDADDQGRPGQLDDPVELALRQAQELLGRKGFKPGGSDGVLRPETIAAVRDFETAIGLRASGRIEPRLLEALRAANALLTGGTSLNTKPVRSYNQPDLFVAAASDGAAAKNLSDKFDFDTGGSISGDQSAPRGGFRASLSWLDATHVATIAAQEGRANIYVFDVTSGASKPLSAPPVNVYLKP